MKYVAFLDILGFKNKLKSMTQQEAKKYIGDFSAIVYSIFQSTDSVVNGYIVSDSVILHTSDTKLESLQSIITTVDAICKNEFAQNGILIRGAIAKGEFDKMPAMELPKLQKQLIVGQAYVDAYLLEDKVKTIGINLSEEVYQDVLNSNSALNILEEKINEKMCYVYRYLTLDYLLIESNMKKFIKLAQEAKWLPHYYNTLYFAMKRETSDKKIEQLFINIQNIVSDNSPGENWRELDVFFKNAFAERVIDEFKTRLLKHIRINIV